SSPRLDFLRHFARGKEHVLVANLDQVFAGTDEYTLFAPSNAAFTQLLTDLGANSLNDIPVDVLSNVLLNHVVPGEKKAAALSTGYVTNLLPYAGTSVNQSLFINTASGVKVNDATVTAADADASNGVVHTINKVMLPTTVVNQALNNPEFSSLVAALTRSDLGVDYVSILSGTGPFTVFAPTNAAFAALLTELNLPNLNAIPAATLNSVLQYHVVNGANVRAENLTNGQVVTTFGGGTFTVGLTGGAKITDAKARVSNIIATNVQANNGVVHAIDKVLLP
ncbi:MAG: fasciclin domain-containing protein, partial [Saprospiraceae bacterium]